ncbi:MAG: hypothetical protein HKO92_06255, partial [Flavobacteriaceae bacterium]|nr:hypothetical protein [Flavobacteriaceae bacterium]
MNKSIYLLLLFGFLVFSCEHDPLYTPIEDNSDDNVIVDDVCDPDKIYFVNDVLPIINSNCAISGCHGGGSAQDGVDLSSYNGIMQQVDVGNAFSSDLYEAITDNDVDDIMPPPPSNPLNPEQILTIRDWINQGATNEECSECDLANITFSQSVWPIIQNNCTGCHSGASPQGNLSLTNYDEVAQIASNGYLSGVINHEAGFI